MAGVARASALPLVTRLHEGRSDRMAVWDPRDAAALRVLLSQFDLVGAALGAALCPPAAWMLTHQCLVAVAAPMEQFDEALLLVCRTMGFSAPGYKRLNEGVKRDIWSMYRQNLSAADQYRMSNYGTGWIPRADEELAREVARVASVDVRLYVKAAHAFNKTVCCVLKGRPCCVAS